MSYSAYDVVNYMHAHPGTSAFDAKRALADPVILDPVQRYTAKHTDPDYIFYNATQGFEGLAQMLYRISESNSAWSRQEAADLRNWQEGMFKLQSDFNLSEAAKNRDWQQMMSNTAHQREIADLKAAGLNPVLSAMNGNGAAVTSGATASATAPSGAMGTRDTSASGAIVSLLSSMVAAQTQLANQAVSAYSNQAIADKNNTTSALIAEMSNQTSRDNAMLSYLAARYGADSSRIASEYASWLAHDSSLYNADMSYKIAEEFPNNLGAGAARMLPGLFGFGSWKDAGNKAGVFVTRALDDLVQFLMVNDGKSLPQAVQAAKDGMRGSFGNTYDSYEYDFRRSDKINYFYQDDSNNKYKKLGTKDKGKF